MWGGGAAPKPEEVAEPEPKPQQQSVDDIPVAERDSRERRELKLADTSAGRVDETLSDDLMEQQIAKERIAVCCRSSYELVVTS